MHVLFATDFSRTSRKAFTTAVRLAKTHGGRLTILHVRAPITAMVPENYLATPTWEEIDREGRARVNRELEKLRRKAGDSGVRASILVVDGEPSQHIVRAARSKHADLLVLGTHGRTGLSKFLLGSIANRVVATAPCPVVTVRGN
jgi:nucleotide-binding universal stress UspA family protein